jgi:hypothetical protein
MTAEPLTIFATQFAKASSVAVLISITLDLSNVRRTPD